MREVSELKSHRELGDPGSGRQLEIRSAVLDGAGSVTILSDPFIFIHGGRCSATATS